MEIVQLRDGTYVLLDKDNCLWLFGFDVGDVVVINYFDYDKKTVVERKLQIVKVAKLNTGLVIVGKDESDFYVIDDVMIVSMEGGYVC